MLLMKALRTKIGYLLDISVCLKMSGKVWQVAQHGMMGWSRLPMLTWSLFQCCNNLTLTQTFSLGLIPGWGMDFFGTFRIKEVE